MARELDVGDGIDHEPEYVSDDGPENGSGGAVASDKAERAFGIQKQKVERRAAVGQGAGGQGVRQMLQGSGQMLEKQQMKSQSSSAGRAAARSGGMSLRKVRQLRLQTPVLPVHPKADLTCRRNVRAWLFRPPEGLMRT